MHAEGSQLVPMLLLKLPDTLHIQYSYIEHVHEEVSCKKKYFWQNGCLSNLAILYDMCIDSAYVGNSSCTTALLKQFDTLPTQYIDLMNICMKKFDAKKCLFTK